MQTHLVVKISVKEHNFRTNSEVANRRALSAAAREDESS